MGNKTLHIPLPPRTPTPLSPSSPSPPAKISCSLPTCTKTHLPLLTPPWYHYSFFHTESTAMGIHGLSKVIGDNANEAIKEDDIKNYFGRKVAIDASMSIYQFMIAVRQQDGQLL